MPRASSSSGDSSGNPWFHDLQFMDFFGSPRGEFTGTIANLKIDIATRLQGVSFRVGVAN